jgi:outer membrane receptor protein involved in Fe transport
VSWLTLALLLQAQPSPPPQTQGQVPVVRETVEVVAVTPVHGLGVPTTMVPANIQVLSSADLERRTGSQFGDVLASRLASVHVNDAQNNPFQGDVQFRGFTVSPLLGLSQGVAVYLDGVRTNEPFGDTVNWDLLPMNAVASANVVPGSNPLFGLNALGGALSFQTKTGFSHPGHTARAFTGSFGRQWLEVTSAARSGNVSYFVTANGLREDGWRDHSPSRVGQFFGNVEWRSGPDAVGVSVIGGAGRLIGNGAAPVDLLEIDREAIFTHPDRTTTRAATISVRASRTLATGSLEGVFYVRPAKLSTFNGDDTEYDECEDEDVEELLCDDDGDGDPVLTPDGDGIPVDDDAPFDGTNNYSNTRTTGWGGTIQATRTAAFGGRENRFLAGLSFDRGGSDYDSDTEIARLDDTRGTIGTGLFDGAAAVRLRSTATHTGAYVADFLRLSPRVTLSGSARLTHSSIRLEDGLGDELNGEHSFTRLNPSAGLTVDLGSGVTAFGSVSVSSRVPTPSELGCADPEDPCRLPNAFVADPPLDAVVARNVEVGARGRATGLSWSASFFRTAISDDIIFISSGALTNSGHFENIGETRRAGLEAMIAGSAGAVSWSGSYTHLRATFASPLTLNSPNHPDEVDGEIAVLEGNWIPGVPRHNLKGEVAANLGRLSLHGEANRLSSFYLRGDEANALDPIEGRTLVNLGAAWRLTSRLRLTGRITNLFNAEYSSFGLLGEADDVLGDDFEDPRFEGPGAPRAAWIGLEIGLR